MERNSVTCARGNARAYIQKSGVVLLPVLTPSRTSEHRTHARPAPPAALPARVGSSATNSQISLQLSLTYTLNYTPTLYASQDAKLVKRHLVVHGMATLMIGQPATWTSPPLACCP